MPAGIITWLHLLITQVNVQCHCSRVDSNFYLEVEDNTREGTINATTVNVMHQLKTGFIRNCDIDCHTNKFSNHRM